MPDRSIWGCPSRYRRLSTASVARPLRQNSKPAIADNALFPRLFRASQVYICRKTFGYLLRPGTAGHGKAGRGGEARDGAGRGGLEGGEGVGMEGCGVGRGGEGGVGGGG